MCNEVNLHVENRRRMSIETGYRKVLFFIYHITMVKGG